MAQNVTNPVRRGERLLEALSSKQDELEHVSRILHEDVGQVLTVVGLHLDVLRQDFAAQSPTIASRTEEIQELLEKALHDIRQLSYRLNPGIVPRSGLRYGLDTLVGNMRDSSPATIRLLMDSQLHLPLPIAVTFYEIATEGLENAVQHSGATLIELLLQRSPGSVRMEIKDNGKGFDLPAALAEGGFGLPWMEHRARRAGLEFRAQSEPGKGTILCAVHHEHEGK